MAEDNLVLRSELELDCKNAEEKLENVKVELAKLLGQKQVEINITGGVSGKTQASIDDAMDKIYVLQDMVKGARERLSEFDLKVDTEEAEKAVAVLQNNLDELIGKGSNLELSVTIDLAEDEIKSLQSDLRDLMERKNAQLRIDGKVDMDLQENIENTVDKINELKKGTIAAKKELERLNGTGLSDLETAMGNLGRSTSSLTGEVLRLGAGFLSLSAIKNFGQQVFQVRAQFQDAESTMKTFLGSAEQGTKFFNELKDYAWFNMFEFTDLQEASTQLIAYGNAQKDLIPIIDQLSNVASATGKPLMQYIEMWNKAKSIGTVDSRSLQSWAASGLVVKDVLKEMGEEVNGNTISFEQLKKAIDYSTNNEAGQFYGVMADRMGNLSASLGQLQDNWANMLNEIGEKTQGPMKKAIDIAVELVDNYETVGKWLAALITMYGSYKAAMVIASTTAAIHNGIHAQSVVLENAETASLTKLIVGLKGFSWATGQATGAQAAFNAAVKANIYVALAAAVISAVVAITKFVKAKKAATEAESELSEENLKQLSEQKKELDNLENLYNAAKDAAAGTDARRQAIKNLNTAYGQYFKNQLTEIAQTREITSAYTEAAMAIKEAHLAKMREQIIGDSGNDKNEILAKVSSSANGIDASFKLEQIIKTFYANGMKEEELFEKANEALNEYYKNDKEYQDNVNKIVNSTEYKHLVQRKEKLDYRKIGGTITDSAYEKEIEEIEAQMEALKKKADNGMTQRFVDSVINSKQKFLEYKNYEGTYNATFDKYNIDKGNELKTSRASLAADIKQYDDAIMEYQRILQSGGKISDNEQKTLEENIKKRSEAIKQYNNLTGLTYKTSLDMSKLSVELQKQIAKSDREVERALKDAEYNAREQRINNLKDENVKLLAQNELNHEKEMEQLRRQREDKRLAIEKELEDEWKKKGNNGVYKVNQAEVDARMQKFEPQFQAQQQNIDLKYSISSKNAYDKMLEEFANVNEQMYLTKTKWDKKILEAEMALTAATDAETKKRLQAYKDALEARKGVEVAKLGYDSASQYGGFTEKKIATEQYYEALIEEAPPQFKEALRRKLTNELSNLDFEQFKLSINWEGIFGDLSGQKIGTLQKNMEMVQNYLTIKGDSLGVDEIKALQEALSNLSNEIANRNPFTSIFESAKGLKAAQDEVKEAAEEYEQALADLKAAQDRLKGEQFNAKLGNAKLDLQEQEAVRQREEAGNTPEAQVEYEQAHNQILQERQTIEEGLALATSAVSTAETNLTNKQNKLNGAMNKGMRNAKNLETGINQMRGVMGTLAGGAEDCK